MKALLVMSVTLLGLIFGACMPPAGMGLKFDPVVPDRAAFDRTCPREQLTASALGDWRVQGVSGCGKRATYVWIDGMWLDNSESSHGVALSAAYSEQVFAEEQARREEEAAAERAKKVREEEARQAEAAAAAGL